MSIIDTDSARAWRIQLAHLRQELLSPVNALLGYAEILHEEASRNGRPDILPDMNRILGAARDLAGKVDRLVDGDRAKSPPGSAAATQEQELRHELRTPLNAIKGYGEMLREDVANFSSELAAGRSRSPAGGGHRPAAASRSHRAILGRCRGDELGLRSDRRGHG